jgi:hypothetical protein
MHSRLMALAMIGVAMAAFCVPFWVFSSTSGTSQWMFSDPRFGESCTRLRPDLNERSRSLLLSQRISWHRQW